VILARPLVRPEREGFLSEHLLKRFTLPSLPNLNTLPPETIKDICFYLDPYPELVAITYALSVAIRYKTHRTHSWTDLDLKPGMTLYMTFSNFERCTYLTNIDNKPSAKYDKMLQVQDEFQVCRDHFAIQDIHGTGDRLYGHNVRGESVFYQTINLRKIGRKELKIRGFSDVGISRFTIITVNIYRVVFSEPFFLSTGAHASSNGIYRLPLYKERPTGFRKAAARFLLLIDVNTMISTTFQASPRPFKVPRLSVFSAIDKNQRRDSDLLLDDLNGHIQE
jgi:hypothetical protein